MFTNSSIAKLILHLLRENRVMKEKYMSMEKLIASFGSMERRLFASDSGKSFSLLNHVSVVADDLATSTRHDNETTFRLE